MNNQKERMRVIDIPHDFYGSITRQIINYGVGILKVVENEKIEDATLIGSGTLVDIKGILGILTAQHVIDKLPINGNIGFVISENLHKYVLGAQTISSINIGIGKDPETGPDLGIIILPDTAIGSIKAHKSFYNIGLKRDKILENPPDNDLGVWCICGIPDIETKFEGPTRGFDTVKAFLEFCGFGGISKEYSLDKFDYFNFDVHYNERTQSPKSFGGVSGGGLWQVIITQKPDGELIVKDTILSGVAFYQTPLLDNKRIIKCHGRKSIYSHVFNLIKGSS